MTCTGSSGTLNLTHLISRNIERYSYHMPYNVIKPISEVCVHNEYCRVECAPQCSCGHSMKWLEDVQPTS